MRPPKRVLLVDAAETRRRVRGFLLWSKGFRVDEAADVSEALLLCEQARFDVVVLMLCGPAEQLALKLASRAMMLAIVPHVRDFDTSQADAALLPKCSSLEFVERVRLLAKRKRGPKKVQPGMEASSATA